MSDGEGTGWERKVKAQGDSCLGHHPKFGVTFFIGILGAWGALGLRKISLNRCLWREPKRSIKVENHKPWYMNILNILGQLKKMRVSMNLS